MRSEEDKRRADLITIIELKQAALDAQVARLGAQARAIDFKQAQLARTVQAPPTETNLLWLGQVHETAHREGARLRAQRTELDGEIRDTLGASVSLEVAKRKLSGQS